MTLKPSLLDEIDQQGSRLAKAEADLYDLTIALSYAFDGTAKMDKDGKYVYVNDLYAANFGYTTRDLQGMPWQTTVVDGDRAAMAGAIEYCRKHGRAELEAKGLRKDGSIFWKKVALVRIPPDMDKAYQGYYAFVRDITDSKRWATELQRSEQRFSTLVRSTSAIVWVRDTHGEFSENQPSWQAFTGQVYEDYCGIGWMDCVHDNDKLRVAELWSRAVMNQSIYEAEYRLRRADGVYRDMFTRAAPIFEEDGSLREWIGSSEDITQQKEDKKRFQVLTDTMPQLVWSTDADGKVLYRNEGWYEYTGLDPNDAEKSGQTIHPEDREHFMGLWREALANQSYRYEGEARIRRHDGIYRWFLVRGTPVLDNNGVFQYWIGTCTDVDDRKKDQIALALSQARMKAILDAALDAIISMDSKGMVIEWNPACERIFGWTREEAMGKELATLIIPEGLRQSHKEGLLRFNETGRATILDMRLDMPAVSKSGAHLDTELTVVPVKTEDAIFFTAYIRDVTERNRVARLLKLGEKTLATAANGIVISDCSQPDEPIIYCNPAFEKLSGYSQEEVIGRNCRFLQGPNTDRKSVRKLREAIRDRKSTRVCLLNYRKNGTPFWNDVTISPVLDEKGLCTNYIGVQYQVDGKDVEVPATHDITESKTNEPS